MKIGLLKAPGGGCSSASGAIYPTHRMETRRIFFDHQDSQKKGINVKQYVLGLMALQVLTGCGMGPTAQKSSSKSLIDFDGIEIVRSIDNGQDVLLVVATEADGTRRGYRTRCGSNVKTLADGFGYGDIGLGFLNFIDNPSEDYAALRVDEQPILECNRKEAVTLYSVVDSKIDEAIQSSYFVKFNSRPNEIYALGCANQFEFLGVKPENAVLVTQASLGELVPTQVDEKDPNGKPKPLNYKRLRCYGDTGRVAKPFSGTLTQHTIEPIRSKSSSLYQVKNNGRFPEIKADIFPSLLVNTPVVKNNKETQVASAFAIDCGANVTSFFDALGYKVQNMNQLQPMTDEVFQASVPRNQAILKCGQQASSGSLLSKVYNVVNDRNKTSYVRFAQKPGSLVRLGCPKLQNFFGVSKVPAIQVTKESLLHLTAQGSDSDRQLIDVACNGISTDDVQAAFIAVFGVSAWPEKISGDLLAMQQNEVQDFNGAVDFYVNGQANTDFEKNLIALRAFSAAQGRDPSEREKAFILNGLFTGTNDYGIRIRPHHNELRAHLSRVRIMSDADMMKTCREAYGIDCYLEGLTWWTGEFLSRTDKVYDHASVVDAHVEYIRQNDEPLVDMIRLAMQTAHQREPAQSEWDELFHLIRDKRSLRAHYLTVLDFVRQNYTGIQAGQRNERVGERTFSFQSRCNSRLTLSLLIYTSQDRWEYQTHVLNQGQSLDLKTKNRWVYWYAELDNGSFFPGNSSVMVPFGYQKKASSELETIYRPMSLC